MSCVVLRSCGSLLLFMLCIHENASENLVCEMVTILFGGMSYWSFINHRYIDYIYHIFQTQDKFWQKPWEDTLVQGNASDLRSLGTPFTNMNWFNPTLCNKCNYLFILGLNFILVSERGSRSCDRATRDPCTCVGSVIHTYMTCSKKWYGNTRKLTWPWWYVSFI